MELNLASICSFNILDCSEFDAGSNLAALMVMSDVRGMIVVSTREISEIEMR